MITRRFFTTIFLLAAAMVVNAKSKPGSLRVDPKSKFEVVNGSTSTVDYRGRKAIKVSALAGHEQDDGDELAVLPGPDFQDGTIEADVSGAPHAGAKPNMKGFIGIAFRIQERGVQSELIYLRPVNARTNDQLMRNHSVQYVSSPDFTWQRLRKDFPGVYESYADMETGAWTHMKIVVHGDKAQLYVNRAAQPCLIVDDLKRGESRGRIGLWAHNTTDAYFSNVTVRPED